MAVKLHRCSTMWLKGPHPCWKVQKALDDAGIEYEVVKNPVRRSKRADYIALTGQKLYPSIQLEDGTVIRRESKELIEMVRSGQLQSASGAGAAPPAEE
jgi:glutaredoxin